MKPSDTARPKSLSSDIAIECEATGGLLWTYTYIDGVVSRVVTPKVCLAVFNRYLSESISLKTYWTTKN